LLLHRRDSVHVESHGWDVHTPLTQDLPAMQALLQAPQCELSVRRSRQPPLQRATPLPVHLGVGSGGGKYPSFVVDGDAEVLRVERRLELGRKVELERGAEGDDDAMSVFVELGRVLLGEVGDVEVADEGVAVLLSEEIDSVLLCKLLVPLLSEEDDPVKLEDEEDNDVVPELLNDEDEIVPDGGGGGGRPAKEVVDDEDVSDEELDPVLLDMDRLPVLLSVDEIPVPLGVKELPVLLGVEELPALLDEDELPVLLESEVPLDDELAPVVLNEEIIPLLLGEELVPVLLREDTDSVTLAEDDVPDEDEDVPLVVTLKPLLDDALDEKLVVDVLLSAESVRELLKEDPVLELLPESVLEPLDDKVVMVLLEGTPVVTVLLREELKLLIAEPVLELLTVEPVLEPDEEELKAVLLEESEGTEPVLLVELADPVLALEELVVIVPEELALIESLAEELLISVLLDTKPLLALPLGEEETEGGGEPEGTGHDVPVTIVFVKVAVMKKVVV